MITRIEIDGFKSFQDFALDLEPFTVLIGPNGAGKSNLLDALSLLGRIATSDLATAFNGGRGRPQDQFARELANPVKGYGTLATARFAVEVLRFPLAEGRGPASHSLSVTRLRYELMIELQQMGESPRQRFMVAREMLRALSSGEDAWLARHPAFRPLARHAEALSFFALDRRGQLTVADPSASALAEKDVSIQYVPETAFLSTPDIWRRSPHAVAMREELRALRVLHLTPHRLHETSDRSAPPVLAADGAGLPALLAAVAADESAKAADDQGPMAKIRADLASLVPGIKGFDVVVDGDTLTVMLESGDGQRFPSRVLSDGTLRILALSTLLRTGTEGALVAIEEPENGLYPGRVRTLVERILDATSGEKPPQVLVTTHSPVVLAALMDHPEHIVCFDMVRHGAGLRRTRARTVAPSGDLDRERHVSSGELRRLLEAASRVEPSEP